LICLNFRSGDFATIGEALFEELGEIIAKLDAQIMSKFDAQKRAEKLNRQAHRVNMFLLILFQTSNFSIGFFLIRKWFF
jgi:hypothetical protein